MEEEERCAGEFEPDEEQEESRLLLLAAPVSNWIVGMPVVDCLNERLWDAAAGVAAVDIVVDETGVGVVERGADEQIEVELNL